MTVEKMLHFSYFVFIWLYKGNMQRDEKLAMKKLFLLSVGFSNRRKVSTRNKRKQKKKTNLFNHCRITYFYLIKVNLINLETQNNN